MTTDNLPAIRACRPAWNKGRIVGQKRPLLPKHVWAIRVRLEIATNVRDLALFNLAIDSKLRGCDLVRLRVADVYAAGQVKERASIIQSKTRKPVRFEITEGTRKSITAWLDDPIALQLHVSSKVCLPCCGLMSPSPHRPSDNISRFNLTLGQPIGDASDLLN